MTENRNTAAQTTAQHTENARETMEDKIKRLLRNEIQQNVTCL